MRYPFIGTHGIDDNGNHGIITGYTDTHGTIHADPENITNLLIEHSDHTTHLTHPDHWHTLETN